MTRGPRVCRNRWQPSLAPLEDLVLDTIETEVLNPAVVERAIAEAAAILDAPDTDGQAERATLAGELATLDAELARLTALAASGGLEIPAVLDGLRSRQARRDALLARQAALGRRAHPAASGAVLRRTLRTKLADWRGLLRRNVTEARPVIEALLAGRVIVTPRLKADELQAFDLRIPLTTRGIIQEICGLRVWRPRRGLTGRERLIPSRYRQS